MKRKDIIRVYNTGPVAVIRLVESLIKIIDRQGEDIADLKKRIKALEDRLSQNSSNSSRSPEGQKGHRGHNLKMTGSPDSITIHGVSSCSGCGRSLEDISPAGYRKRQVFDLPPIEVEVTENIGRR